MTISNFLIVTRRRLDRKSPSLRAPRRHSYRPGYHESRRPAEISADIPRRLR
jgi:hypothetical protein